jgi:hypothetical protein
MIDRRHFLKLSLAFTATLTGLDSVAGSWVRAAEEAYRNLGGLLHDHVNEALKVERFRLENAVILDRLTGLMWARNKDPLGVLWPAYSYSGAQEVIKELNANGFAGNRGWRLPGEYDWVTVIDNRRRKPALVKGFDVGDVTYEFPYWIRQEGGGNRACAQLNNAVSCLPPRRSVQLESGGFPLISPSGMVLPVRTHDREHYENFVSFFLDWMDPEKSKGRPIESLLETMPP